MQEPYLMVRKIALILLLSNKEEMIVGNIAHNQVIIMTDVIGGFYLSNGNREVIIEHSSAEPLSIGGESLAFSDGGVIVAKEDGIPLFVMYTGGDIFELNRLLYTAKEVVSRFLLGKKYIFQKLKIYVVHSEIVRFSICYMMEDY